MSKIRTWIILEDLMKNALHPRRIIRFLELGGVKIWMIFETFIDIILILCVFDSANL